jgi:hypothetical protein
MGMLFDPEGLRSSFERQEERKASGVDGVKKADYREGLEERIQELSRRVRSLGYRPKPVRRVYIPKGGRVDTDRWGSPALRTDWCRIGLARFCKRSGSRSSVIAHMDFGPTEVPMMR